MAAAIAERSSRELGRPTIIGRSSSHFTRVARLFARELEVEHDFEVVTDLLSCDPGDYGGNPALRIPILRAPTGVWFGALNICRELARRTARDRAVVWPEDLTEPLLANAQELTLGAMATEVTLIMAKLAQPGDDGVALHKARQSLSNTLSWLDQNAREIVGQLPAERDLSTLEVTLYCLVTHLRFRQVLPMDPYVELDAFCVAFGGRSSARETEYRFD
ncbi:MAG TPA: glutathione S-transferase N-terminal domain-containing protein [Polyangiaceae bacterium]|nr:glutathione S-transferase N-terminal domain-containing protein [Polyangiaceae bacterium]